MSIRKQLRLLVIVVRADPVICGHSGEARNLAEAAIQRGLGQVFRGRTVVVSANRVSTVRDSPPRT